MQRTETFTDHSAALTVADELIGEIPMRTMPRRQLAVLLLSAITLILPTSALAALTRIVGPTGLITEGKLFVRFDAAFDTANQVHLAVWGTQHPGPTKGMFLNAAGAAITGAFPISGGVEQAGWARVIYSAEQGKYLVAYTKILGGGVHQRVVRFVAFQAPNSYVMSGETIIDTWAGGAGTEAGIAYSRGRFLVTWWNWNSNPPQSYVAILDANGTVIVPKVTVSTAGDGQTDPEIDCDPNRGRCLVIGHSWGVWSQPYTATWAQLISDDTGQPIGAGFYVSWGPLQKEPSVTYSRAGDQYIVAFSRNQNAVWATRMSAASPGPGGATYLLKSAVESPEGAGYGRPRLAYNALTQTSIVAIKPWIATTGVLELNAIGDVIPGTFQMTPQVVSWEEGTQEIAPSADPVNRRFMVADNQAFVSMRASIFAADGGTTPPPPPPPPPTVPVVAREKARADFNNDNWYDLLWQNYATGHLAIWNLAGSAIGGAQLVDVKLNDPSWRAVGTADFDGDAAPDILWRHPVTGELVIWYMRNSVVMGSDYLTISPIDTRWNIVGVGDLNGDGKSDIVWRHNDGWLAAWMMNGKIVLSSTLLSPDRVTDTAWKVVAVSDFNDDGRMDLFWRHDDGTLSVWLMNGTSYFSELAINPGWVDPAWKIVGVIDGNLDNKMDLVWQHANGWIAMWYMSGGTRIGSAHLGPGQVTDTNWKIAGPK